MARLERISTVISQISPMVPFGPNDQVSITSRGSASADAVEPDFWLDNTICGW